MQLRICLALACAALVACAPSESAPLASRIGAFATDPDATADIDANGNDTMTADPDFEVVDTFVPPPDSGTDADALDTFVPPPDSDPDSFSDSSFDSSDSLADSFSDSSFDSSDSLSDSFSDSSFDSSDSFSDSFSDSLSDSFTDSSLDSSDSLSDSFTDSSFDSSDSLSDSFTDSSFDSSDSLSDTTGDSGPDAETCACDDHNACNGVETCDADGNCIPGTAIDCDDSKACTTDSCNTSNGNCSYTPDLTQCTCSGVPIANTYTANFSLEDATTSCPIVGGSAGFTTALAFNGSYTQPHCANSCTSNLTVSGSLTSSLLLCKDSLAVSGAASYTGTDTACPGCNTTTCEKNCSGGGSCKQNTFSATASMTYSRFYGYQMKETKAGTTVEIKCGATLSGTPSVSLSGSRTTNSGYSCGTCTDCLQANGSVGFGVSGSVGCFVSFNIFNGLFKQTLGCPTCGNLGVNVYGGIQGQKGACGGGMCAYAGAKANASATTPCVGFSIGFIGFAAQCTASASACAEGSGCGTCSSQCTGCAQATGGLSCSVSSSGTCP